MHLVRAVVDNLPVIVPEKVEKLLTVLRKIYTSQKIGGEIREGASRSIWSWRRAQRVTRARSAGDGRA